MSSHQEAAVGSGYLVLEVDFVEEVVVFELEASGYDRADLVLLKRMVGYQQKCSLYLWPLSLLLFVVCCSKSLESLGKL